MLKKCEVIDGVCQACGPVAAPDCMVECVCDCHRADVLYVPISPYTYAELDHSRRLGISR